MTVCNVKGVGGDGHREVYCPTLQLPSAAELFNV